MDISPELTELASNLAASAARNGARIVADRIGAARTAGKSDETIVQLEQIINDLIADKNELLRISQAYQAELIAQRLTPGDVKYITDTVVPVIEKVMAASPDGGTEATARMMELLKPLLSVETVNVLQLLGFNFRRAVGEPLTELIERSILSRASSPDPVTGARIRELELEREVLIYKIATDPDSYARMARINGTG